MKNRKLITTIFLASLFCVFVSCANQVAKIENESESSESGNGTVKVNMFVPNYDLISENARAIAPQTESIKFSYKIGDAWTSLDAVKLSSATTTKIENAEDGLFGNVYNLTFSEIPCGTYVAGTLKVELLDSDNSVVTSGTNSSKVIISKALTAKSEFYTIPTDFVSFGEETSIKQGKMQFLSVTLEANNVYAFQLTIKEEYNVPDVVIFNSDGTYNSYITGSSIDFIDDGEYTDLSGRDIKQRPYKSGFLKKFDKVDSTQKYYIGIYAKDADCSYTAYLLKSKNFGYNTWATNSEDTEGLQDSEGNYYGQDYECNFSWTDLGLDSNYIPVKGDKINVQFSLFLENYEDFFQEEDDVNTGETITHTFFKSANFRSYASEDAGYLNLSDWQLKILGWNQSYHTVLSAGEYIENEGFLDEITYTIENQTKATNTDSLALDICLSPKDGETKYNNRGQIPFWIKSISATVDTSGRNEKITVTYDAGKNATSSIESEELYSGQNLNATATCENKFFVGWSQTENGDVITIAPDENCTLYAIYNDELELTCDLGGSRLTYSQFEDYTTAYLTVDITHSKTTDEDEIWYWCGFGTNWGGNIKEWCQQHNKAETTETVKFLVSDLNKFYKNCEINSDGEAALYFSCFNGNDYPDKVERVYLTYDSSNLTQCLSRMQECEVSLKIGETYNDLKYFLFPQSLTDNCKFYIYNSDSKFEGGEEDCDVISISEENVVTAEKEGYAKCYIKYLDSDNNVLFERDLRHFTVTSETSTSE